MLVIETIAEETGIGIETETVTAETTAEGMTEIETGNHMMRMTRGSPREENRTTRGIERWKPDKETEHQIERPSLKTDERLLPTQKGMEVRDQVSHRVAFNSDER